MSNGMRNSKAAHIDFGFLQGSIQAKPAVMPSNIDMVLCKNGVRFLFGEWKHDTEEMPFAQKIICLLYTSPSPRDS